MFLLDDLLMLPIRGIHALAREIQDRARVEDEENAASLRDRLATLYMQLETGQLTQEEFDRSELDLVTRLEAVQIKLVPEPALPRRRRRALSTRATRATREGGEQVADPGDGSSKGAGEPCGRAGSTAEHRSRIAR